MYHYDAFISYNHNPRDINVTRSIQHRLENYKLPKGTGTAYGKEKIERVFLDSGELEASGDLSKALQDALNDADDLIVICSPESKSSIWVNREIEFFLKTHPIENVHAVLTEGELYDVLPDALLYEESEDEEGNKVQKIREPLACDYRMPLSKANRQELPRLVAALVGCRYDDLVQRQKQYRMKRQISLLAATAVFLSSAIGYLVWSNHKIKESLNSTLREESINLAIQSEQALSRGNRVAAIRYALDALPSEGNERPVVPRAVMALSKAIDLYKTSASEGWNAVRQFESKGRNVNCMRTASVSDRKFFAELFTSGAVSLWDADSGKELMADYIGPLEKISDIAFTDDGRFIMLDSKTIYVVDPVKENEIKKIEMGNDDELVFYYDSEPAIAEGILWANLSHYDSDAMETKYELVKVDIDKGKITEKHLIHDYTDRIVTSPDGRYIAYSISGYDYDSDNGGFQDNPDTVNVIDTKDKDGFKNAASFEKAFITDLEFINDTCLVVSGLDSRPDMSDQSQYSSVDLISYGHRMLYSKAVEKNVFISAVDAAKGSRLWEHEYTLFGSGTGDLIPKENGVTGWDIMFALGDTVLTLDKEGEEIAQLNTSSNIAGFYNRDDLIRAIMINGEMAFYEPEKGEMTTLYNNINAPVGDIAVLDNEIIFVENSDPSILSFAETVTEYKFQGADHAWEAYEYDDDCKIDGKEYKDLKAAAAASDGRFLEVRYDLSGDDNGGDIQLLVRNSDDGNIVLNRLVKCRSEKDYYQGVSLDYLGVSASGDKAYFIDDHVSDGVKLLTVDLSDGSEKLTDLDLDDPEDDTDSYRMAESEYAPVRFGGEYSEYAGDLCLLMTQSTYEETETGYSGKDTLILAGVDPDTGEAVRHNIKELGEDEWYGNVPCKVNAACGRLLLLEADEENSTTKLVCYGFDGSVIWTNDSVPGKISGLLLMDDGSAAIIEDRQDAGVVHFYSEKDGNETASTEIAGVDTSGKGCLRYCSMSDEESMLTLGTNAFLMDPDTKEVRTVVGGSYIAYDPVNKVFMLGDANDQDTGHVPYRSLDGMIEEARAMLE